jgi:hypothetical protein
MTPTEFELQIARIQSALAGAKAKVRWNDRFPDPDNPSQLRQVDITIRRDKTLAIVECRYHSRPQDVKWIEELYGRKVSLNADTVIGVSSAGFTKGATEKARRLGVFLRSLSELSDQEIQSWGKRTKVTISHMRFFDLRFLAVTSDIVALPDVEHLEMLRGPGGRPFDFSSAISNVAKGLDERNIPEGPFTIQLHLTDTTLGSMPVTEAILSARFKWVHRDVRLPFVMVYGASQDVLSAESLIEKNTYSRSEIYHTPDGAFPVIDISSLVEIEQPFMKRITVALSEGVLIKGIGVVGINESPKTFSKFQFGIITRSSSEYRDFLLRATN